MENKDMRGFFLTNKKNKIPKEYEREYYHKMYQMKFIDGGVQVSNYMSNEEFYNCHTIDHRELYEIEKELECQNISDLLGKIKHVKENYRGQMQMHYMLQELNNVILSNFHEVNDEYMFSKSAVDGLLRSYLFAIRYMQEGLPEHVYDYIKGKSGTFFRELMEQYEENENLENYLFGNK